MKYQYTIDTKIGKLTIKQDNNHIISISRSNNEINNDFITQQTDLIKDAKLQIDEYLNGKRQYFEIAIKFSGTSFQKRVWKSVMNIPYGETKTYSQIADDINHPRASRAVGSALNRSPMSLIIPAHRVVSKKDNLGSFGDAMDLKLELLDLERRSQK